VVEDAIAFQEGLGLEAIRRRNAALVRHVRRRLGEELGLTPWTPDRPEMCGFLTAFRLPPGVHGKSVQQALWERERIEVPAVERPYGWLLRVSTHFYNTEEEIDRLAAALPGLLDD
jgi:isopenicillin-N epimerase